MRPAGWRRPRGHACETPAPRPPRRVGPILCFGPQAAPVLTEKDQTPTFMGMCGCTWRDELCFPDCYMLLEDGFIEYTQDGKYFP